jgi:hypothetical protein
LVAQSLTGRARHRTAQIHDLRRPSLPVNAHAALEELRSPAAAATAIDRRPAVRPLLNACLRYDPPAHPLPPSHFPPHRAGSLAFIAPGSDAERSLAGSQDQELGRSALPPEFPCRWQQPRQVPWFSQPARTLTRRRVQALHADCLPFAFSSESWCRPQGLAHTFQLRK